MVVTAHSWQGSIVYLQIPLQGDVCYTCVLDSLHDDGEISPLSGMRAPGGGICGAAEDWQRDRTELPSFAHLLKNSSVISFLQLSKGLSTSQSAYIPAVYASRLVLM